MVSLLLLGVVMKYSLQGGSSRMIGALMALVCIGAILWGVFQSKKEAPGLQDE